MITRIRELLDTRQLSPTQFADLIGVGRPVISHILSERNKPSLEVVQKIIGAFPDISLPWLLAGTGPMLTADATTSGANPPASLPIRPELLSGTVVSPIPPATTPIPAPFIAATVAPASSGRATVASQPSTQPQPSKFRPTVSSPPFAAPRPVPAPSPTPTIAVAEPELVAATPAPVPEPSIVLAPSQLSFSQPADLAAPDTSADLTSITSPATAVAEVPAIGPDTMTPNANPAAALSFLGESGKAIRRIVIFYRDGSFSDYLPGEQ